MKTTVIPSPERLQETQLGALGVPSRGFTVGSKTVAMFGSFGLIAMQHLTVWKSCLALVEWSKVLLLGFLSVFYS